MNREAYFSKNNFSWEISLFGGLKIVKEGQPLPPPPYRSYGLLSFLLLRETLPIKRERLGGILYSGLQGDKIRGRMSDHVWLLKKHLPGFPIFSTAEDISLDKTSIWLDVQAFQKTISQADDPLSEKFIQLYQGELLPELYDDWVIVERERWRSHYLMALRKLLDSLIQEHMFRKAISCAERLLREEPYDEGVVRLLMEVYAKVGRRGAALATYEKFNLLSIEELGLEPEALTKNLYDAMYQQKTLPRRTLHSHDDTETEPDKILQHAKTTLEQGEQQLFQEVLSKLPDELTAQQALERDRLLFDEKITWGELGEAEKILQESGISSPLLQFQESRLAIARQEYQKAQELLEIVLDEAHRTKQQLLEAEALVMLSLTKTELGDSQDALLVLDRAIFLAEKINAPAVQVQAYIRKGVFRSLKGTGEDAKEILVKAIELARHYKFRPLLAQALDAIGINANYYGNYHSALEYLYESLELARDLGLGDLEAKVFLSLSIIFDFLGRKKETEEAIKNATKYYKDKQDLYGLAKCYYNLSYSIVNVNEKNALEAIEYAQQALQIFSEHKNLGWQASTNTALGYFQWLAGLIDQAIESFDAAINLHTKTEEYRFIPENYAYKGLAYINKGLPQKAFEFTQIAVREIARRNMSDIASEIYYAHASVLKTLGEEEEAQLYTRLGYDLLVDVAGEIEDDDAREAYFQRDPLSRRLMQMAYDFGIAPRPKTMVLSRELPGSRQAHVDIFLTMDAGAADQALQATKGRTALRRTRLKRILKEGSIHGRNLSIEEIAELFNVSTRTIQRDMKKIQYSTNPDQQIEI